jgi:hypothetical protein
MDLDRDLLFEREQLGEIDHPHPALAQLLDDLVLLGERGADVHVRHHDVGVADLGLLVPIVRRWPGDRFGRRRCDRRIFGAHVVRTIDTIRFR